MRIGVLALQGDFLEHSQMLRTLGAEVVEVRLPADLEGLDGLVIPGGESTTIARLLIRDDLLEPLRQRIKAGLPTMGTCAGMIVMAQHAEGLDREALGLMSIDVKRNAFGRQVDSFEADLPMPDVAQHLGISVAAAKSRLLRARAELKERLGKHCGRLGPATLLAES